MTILIHTLFWLSLGLYGAALAAALLNKDARDACGGAPLARPLLTIALLVHAAMFAVMFFSGKWPADYEFMNSISKSFYAAIALYIGMGRHRSALPTAAGLAVVLFFPLSRLYMSGDLGLQDGMAHAFGPFCVMFYQFSAVAMGIWGYSFAVSVGYLASPGGAPAGELGQSGSIFRSVLWGFVAFSLAQLAGSIWAVTSGWGDVWVWASSHLFSGTMWIFYAGLLHVPSAAGIKNSAMPVMAVAGFVIIFLYTFYHEFVINPAFQTLRSAIEIIAAGGVA